MAVKIGHDLDVYKSLVNGGPATAKQLAKPKKADPILVGTSVLLEEVFL